MANLTDLKYQYFAGQTGQTSDVEYRFFQQETGLPWGTPFEDLKRSYFGGVAEAQFYTTETGLANAIDAEYQFYRDGGFSSNPLILSDNIATWDMVTMSDSQTVTDLSGNGYHLTLGPTSGVDANDPTASATGLTFDGTADYCVAPIGVSLAAIPEFTIVAILKAQAQSDCRLFAEASTTTTNTLITFGTGMGAGNTDKARLFLRTDGAVNEVGLTSTTAIFNNLGYHSVAAGVNATSAELYIDGAADANTARASAGSYSLIDKVAVGALLRSTASAYLKMELAMLAVYARKLSAGEYASLHANWKTELAGRGITLP